MTSRSCSIERGRRIRRVGATVLHHNADGVMPWMRALQSIRSVRTTWPVRFRPSIMGAIARTGADFAVVDRRS